MSDIAWYSLQHVDGESEVAGVPEAIALLQLDARHDFDDKAALMQALDLVVSVDTSHAHLAGALDVPLWLLLPHAADWRWGVAAERHALVPACASVPPVGCARLARAGRGHRGRAARVSRNAVSRSAPSPRAAAARSRHGAPVPAAGRRRCAPGWRR